MKNGFCADEFKEYMDLKKQDRNSEEEARYKELDNKYTGIEVFKGSKSPKEQFEQMNEESYAAIMSTIDDAELKELINSKEYKNAYKEYLDGDKKPSPKEREAARHFALQIAYSERKVNEADYSLNESTFDTFDELPSIKDPFRIMISKHSSDKIDDILKNSSGIYRDDYEFYGDIYGDFDYEVGFSDKKKRDRAVKLLQKAEKNGSLNESESTWTKLKAITEANRIQVKRKYTEVHPAKYVGERARVRNEIIKYLGSNQLMTEDEFEDLLSKNAKHPLLWKKRNRDVYEQGEDGYIRLSKKGYRIFGGLNSVNEAEYIDALNAIETDGFVDAFIVNKIDVKDSDFQYLRKKYVKTYEAITKYLKSKYPTEFMEIEEDFDAVITDFKNFEEFKSLMNDKEFQKLRARYLEIRDNLYDYTESKVNESNLEVDLIDVWTINDKSKLASVLKYLQANNVEFEYNPKNSSVDIIDVSNLTPKGLEELQKMLIS